MHVGVGRELAHHGLEGGRLDTPPTSLGGDEMSGLANLGGLGIKIASRHAKHRQCTSLDRSILFASPFAPRRRPCGFCAGSVAPRDDERSFAQPPWRPSRSDVNRRRPLGRHRRPIRTDAGRPCVAASSADVSAPRPQYATAVAGHRWPSVRSWRMLGGRRQQCRHTGGPLDTRPRARTSADRETRRPECRICEVDPVPPIRTRRYRWVRGACGPRGLRTLRLTTVPSYPRGGVPKRHLRSPIAQPNEYGPRRLSSRTTEHGHRRLDQSLEPVVERPERGGGRLVRPDQRHGAPRWRSCDGAPPRRPWQGGVTERTGRTRGRNGSSTMWLPSVARVEIASQRGDRTEGS